MAETLHLDWNNEGQFTDHTETFKNLDEREALQKQMEQEKNVIVTRSAAAKTYLIDYDYDQGHGFKIKN